MKLKLTQTLYKDNSLLYELDSYYNGDAKVVGKWEQEIEIDETKFKKIKKKEGEK